MPGPGGPGGHGGGGRGPGGGHGPGGGFGGHGHGGHGPGGGFGGHGGFGHRPPPPRHHYGWHWRPRRYYHGGCLGCMLPILSIALAVIGVIAILLF